MLLKKSTVGAGDSMVGGMALSQNKSLKEVIRWGVACGSAATMKEHNCLNSKMQSDYLNG
jgi:6-phosphofructokinase 2